MDLLNRINNTRFLGREFLTWLWYRSEKSEGLFERDGEQIEVWFDAKLVLEAQGDIKEQNVVKSENPTETEEARTSLQTGKQVTEARLRVISDQKQWTVTVKGEDLGLSGMKLPALLAREDEEQLYERFYLMEELEDLLEALYRDFIGVRLNDEAWAQEIASIRTWVQHQ
jgi:hypothetical protein